ncbi:MAG: DUF4062 domain-containing protein [Acidobacteria bacterium]|nr:DUF4062 domain-containing protein [Acidobacteriota bacterium]
MARIYISSTFKDLIQERLAAREAVLTLEHLPRYMESYTASEECPLDICLEDVRSCQAYVGILAWRYGFVPPSYSKSITHLEYEEAGRSGIPRLLFLLADNAPWPADRRDGDPRIAALRNEIRLLKIVQEFSTPDELRAAVTAAVARELGSGRPIPNLLPYLCDRSTQEFELEEALAARPRNRPLLAVVHGDEYQSHEMFFERLQKVSLPRLLDLGDQATVTSYFLRWPAGSQSADEIQKRLRSHLAEAVRNRRTAPVQEIQQTLALSPAPVVLRTQVLTEDFQRLGISALQGFFEFWRQWPDLELGQQLFAILFLKYELKTALAQEKRQAWEELNATLQSFLEDLRFDDERLPGVVLRKLDGVARTDVETWALEEVPPNLCSGDQIFPDIRRLFERWEAEQSSTTIPMEELASRLRALLYGYNSLKELA